MRAGDVSGLFACSCHWKHASVAPDWTCKNCLEIVDGSEGVDREMTLLLAPVYGRPRARALTGEALLRVLQRVEDGELEIEGATLAEMLLPYVRVALQAPPQRKGRKRGGPFINKSHCLAWLREHAQMCVKQGLRITRGRVGLFGSGSGYIWTENVESAAKTVTRWCEEYRIDFDLEVKKFFEH